MMNFRIIKQSIIDIYGAAEAGRYRTIGYQKQSSTSDSVLDTLRTITIYYKSGSLPKSSGVLTGPNQHDQTFIIELMASKAATADLSVINNPESTPEEIAAALAASSEDGILVDDSMDELIEIAYQIAMDARNVDLGLSIGAVANRWVDNIEKGDPLEQGALMVLSASMMLTCRTEEQVSGDVGVEPDPEIYDIELNINEDPNQKTGIEVQNT